MKFKIWAKSYNVKTKKYSKMRTEIIDTEKNKLFKYIQLEKGIVKRFEQFWNTLPDIKKYIVVVCKIEKINTKFNTDKKIREVVMKSLKEKNIKWICKKLNLDYKKVFEFEVLKIKGLPNPTLPEKITRRKKQLETLNPTKLKELIVSAEKTGHNIFQYL